MKIKLSRAEIATIVFVFVAVPTLIITGGPTRWRQIHTCALCRLVRIDYKNIVGSRWSEVEETDCYRWYAKNVDPSHTPHDNTVHLWQRSPSMGGYNAYGSPVWVSDSDRPAGLMMFNADVQLAIYQHIPDIEEAKQIFTDLRNDAESGDKSRYRSVRYRARTLSNWAKSSFAKPWDDAKRSYYFELE